MKCRNQAHRAADRPALPSPEKGPQAPRASRPPGRRRSTGVTEEMGHMRGSILWLACVLTATIALAPAPVHGQGAEFPRPDVELPTPLGHDRMDKGGLFMHSEWVMFKQTNPIKEEPVA